MKIRREIVRPTGLTLVYDPEVPSEDPGLDIVFIHGVGGHPVKTWLHTPTARKPIPTPSPASPASPLVKALPPHARRTNQGSTTTTISTQQVPQRTRSLRSWVSSPGSGGKKDRNTVKKFPYSPARRHRPCEYHHPDGGDATEKEHHQPSVLMSSPPTPPHVYDEVTPWRSYSLSGNREGRALPQPPARHASTKSQRRPFSSAAAAEAEAAPPKHAAFHERLDNCDGGARNGIKASSAIPSGLRRQQQQPHDDDDNGNHVRFVTSHGRTRAPHLLLDETRLAAEAAKAGKYWPQDFLPQSCPNARVYTWGFKTISTFDEGLMPGQFDVFARGRQLIESLEELRGPRRRREVVFVVHSTGAIVLKEMLRLASSFSDTHDEELLASIAGVVFLGCPLRDSPGKRDGTTVEAMRSMASYVTGVSSSDEALREVLGGSEDEHLAQLGNKCFEAVRNEYNFPVKCFRETIVAGPWNDWTERSLALRREASCLVDGEVEDIESDHIGLAKFSTPDNKSYESVASFIVKLAQGSSLRYRSLSASDKLLAQALSIPEYINISPSENNEAEPPAQAKGHQKGRMAPQWLLNHAHTQAWLRNTSSNNSSNNNDNNTNKVLCLSGPAGSARSDLLASFRRHLQTRWDPETHSSLIVSIKAGQDQSPLESVLLLGHSPTTSEAAPAPARPVAAAAVLSQQQQQQQQQRGGAIISTSTAPARALRSLLSQLYTHDTCVRNLVRKQCAQAATAGALSTAHGEIFETPPYYSCCHPLTEDHGHKLHATAAAAAGAGGGSGGNNNNSPSSSTAYYSYSSATQDVAHHSGVACRRWSDPIGTAAACIDKQQQQQQQQQPHIVVEQETKAGRVIRQAAVRLDDADVINLFLDDYLGLDSTLAERNRIDVRPNNHHKAIRIPGIRRVFVLVDASELRGTESTQELLWYLELLAERSDFSICVATMDAASVIDWSELHNGDVRPSRKSTTTLLPVVIPNNNNEEIRLYILERLVPDMEERDAIAMKMVQRAAGLYIWAELVIDIVNDASEEGVSGEVIFSMLDDITPPGLTTAQGKMNALYSWKLRRMNRTEMAQALVLMQWVMLAPEPLRLNELLVAMRLTMLTRPRTGLAGWDMKKTLDVEPAISLKDLRKLTLGERGITMDSPLLFWRWIQGISQGLLRLESAATGEKISSEPLALQRVLPADESVQLYFLQGHGFQILMSLADDIQDDVVPSTERFVDGSYCNMLHACLLYLNMTDLESLGRGAKPLRPLADDLPLHEKTKWRKHAEDQRRMVMSSYPFLRYCVNNLVFHLLCPRAYRYFLPQKDLLRLLTANRCRIWRRWTHLLGFSIENAHPSAILSQASQGAARSVLDPVYGANFRLERVLRKAWKTALDQQLMMAAAMAAGSGGAHTTAAAAAAGRMTHLRSRSDMSESSMVFTLVRSSDDPERAQWLVPASSGAGMRARSASSPAAPSLRRPPVVDVPLSPRYLAGIREFF